MAEEKKVKILLAEDDKFISRAYADGLGREGFDIITAADGNEAVAKARDVKPNLILLDLIMPEKNGFEALEELKADNELKDIPVVVLSNLGQETDIQKTHELGAIDYIIKANFSLQEVVDKIKKILAKE